MKLNRNQKIAFAEFLLSEQRRHFEDIAMIDNKLANLRRQGIVPQGAAPWVEDEDLEDEGDIQMICGLSNATPFGGYWRYQLDKNFENSTGEDNDGFATQDEWEYNLLRMGYTVKKYDEDGMNGCP